MSKALLYIYFYSASYPIFEVQWNSDISVNMKAANSPFNVPSIPNCSDNMNIFH